jgi:hypothetical protein
VDFPVLVDQPRVMTEADLPWINTLCRKRYPQTYSETETDLWYLNVVLKGPLMFFPARTADAFCITMLSATPWMIKSLEANVVFICADDGCLWQAMRLLRASIDWARRRQCTLWRITSETEYDLKPLALRLGAKEPRPRWELQL